MNASPDTAWLEPAPVSTPADGAESSPCAVAEEDWLSITSGFKLPYDNVRFQCMRGSGRVWACDGEYVAYRPYNHALDREANPATAERHARFLASGHYKHVGTFDEVQVFELLAGSPFRRDNRTFIPGVNLYQDMRECARAAVARDWVLYHDILEEIAKNIKGRFGTEAVGCGANAQEVYTDVLAQIFESIRLRGGPTQAEVDAGLANIRLQRGVAQRRAIILPARRA